MPLLFLSFLFAYIAILQIKKHKNIIGFAVLIGYAIAVLLGYVMTLSPIFKQSANSGFQDISYFATLFIALSLLLIFLPLLKYNYNRKLINNVRLSHFLNLSYFAIGVSVIYCFICFPYIKNSLGALDFAEYKADIMLEGFDISNGNPILMKLFGFHSRFRPFVPFMFFYALAFIPKYQKLKISLGLMSILPVLIESLASAHRHILVYALINFFFAFLVFSNYLSSKIKRYIFLFGCSILSCVILVVVYFAVLRFGDEGRDYLIYSLLRYAGEPFVNFNTMMWGTDEFLFGDKSFPIIKELFGYDVIDPSQIRDITANKVLYVNYYFYSIVGNFYMDFGPIGTILICYMIYLIFNKLLNKSNLLNNQFDVLNLLLIYLYASYTVQNYFYFQFQGNANIYIIWLVVFILLFKFYILQKQ